MEVDYTGVESVSSVMRQTGLNKFIIYRYGSNRNNTPVLDFSESNGSSEKAIKAFEDWAKLANNGNAYEMLLFKGDYNDLDSEAQKDKKKKNSIKFSFRVNGENAMYGNNSYGGYGQGTNINLIMENANLKALQQVNDFKFQMQMDQLKKEIQELQEEDDDEDELAGLGKATWMGPLVEHLIGKKIPATSINGPNEANENVQEKIGLTPEQVDNIKAAIRILSKYDDKIDTDLLKLAAIAQKKPDTFNMLLGTLRNM